ncbi:MAG TPA: hypothetical protein VJS90_06785 [Pseudomonas sp.]|uniref:hypothetical protein n=1 Tax=Pseudomonas sp. TaxID=306 RepID=UPI002B45AF9E|nr:hypothetical protein [Pseudomonas sp.]HKS12731.1 hypothetical protein [Pseudomonas sp.]
MSLHKRLAEDDSLSCEVAKRFAFHPLLSDVAGALLVEQWRQRRLGRQFDPLGLYLVTRRPAPHQPWIRPLAHVLIERFCRGRTLNLTTGEDHLSLRKDSDPQWAVEVDAHGVERLINDCGPWLITRYQEALAGFWSDGDSTGQSPWQWYAQYLQEQLRTAVERAVQGQSLKAPAAALARLVQADPQRDEHTSWANSKAIVVSNLRVDLSPGWQLNPDLASSLLLERSGDTPAQTVTLLYTLTGRLLAWESRQQLLDTIARQWPERLRSRPPEVELNDASAQVFEAQALGMLDQYLRLIGTVSATFTGQGRASALARTLDWMTSMVNLCNIEEGDRYAQLFSKLPQWLRDAPAPQQRHYAEMLMDIAQVDIELGDKSWLHAIPSAETFALDKLEQRMKADHQQAGLDLADVQVVNYQVTTAVLPGAGVLVTDNGVREARFSLAQLAIANLGLLQPGRILLQSRSGRTLPGWLDEPYLRRLVADVDIGTAYPRELERRLLDDSVQAAERQQLLMMRLRVQLPAQAMELHLRDQGLTLQGVEAVVRAMSADDQDGWTVAPLGFRRSVDAVPDLALNVWLLESTSPGRHPCVLYRPLHADLLLEFEDRPALLAAISAAGPLQDDLLKRLPPADRRVYDHGGFVEPHLFFPLDDTSAVPFGRPGPAMIAREPAAADLGEAIYRACVIETINHFREQSRSTAQTRWQRWEDLGWLLLNTLAPFTDGPLVKAAWLLQTEAALLQLIDDRPATPANTANAIAMLLANIAMLLISHLAQKSALPSAVPGMAHVTAPIATNEQAHADTGATPTRPDLEHFTSQLDHSWSRPDRQLSITQRTALASLQTTLSPTLLGPPIPSGPLAGLYLFQETLMTLIEGKVYNVTWDEAQAQPRITSSIEGALPGPWLARDEGGRWHLDLRLRLRGGMPLQTRLAQLKVSNDSLVQSLDAQLRQDSDYIVERHTYLGKVAQLATADAPVAILRNYLEKTQAFARFWDEHLERLKQRNDREPLKDYKRTRASALYDSLRTLQSEHVTLQKLYAPKRAQMLEFHKLNQQGHEITAADELILREKLDSLSPLIDQLLSNCEAIHAHYQQLKRLASRSQPQISRLLESAGKLWPYLTSPHTWRYLRMEHNTNRLSLLNVFDGEAGFWLDRAWMNMDLAVSQHLQLEDQPLASDEAMSRLLRSVGQQFAAAQRQLGNLRDYLETASARADLAKLETDLEYFSRQIEQDLTEFPDAPPSSTVQQLRSQLPGLIETADHGLLIGQPRADDSNLVDIPGPDHQASRTYRFEQDQWVEVREAPASRAAPGRQKLSRLLSDGTRLVATAQRELESLQSHSRASYLPVEIEEILQHHRQSLDLQRNAIEQHLTAENLTDEASSTHDAATTIKTLEDMAQTLDQQAIVLRTRAALAQPPRIGELQFLLARHQVQVRREGTRKRLAPVKGRPADFLDEYVVLHQERPLWYAHFHYRASDADKTSFTAGHLKTAEQRYAQGGRTGGAAAIEVYRAPVTLAAAQAVFFSL